MSSRRNFLNVTHVSGKLSATFQFSNMVESFDGYGVAEVFDVWQKCKPQETEAALHHNKDRRLTAFEAKKRPKYRKALLGRTRLCSKMEIPILGFFTALLKHGL